MFRQSTRHARARAAGRGQLGELRGPNLDDGEFGGDEKPVRHDEQERQDEIPGFHRALRMRGGCREGFELAAHGAARILASLRPADRSRWSSCCARGSYGVKRLPESWI